MSALIGRTRKAMITRHPEHVASHTSHSNCPQCNADSERRHVSARPFRYDHVTEYLRYVRPRLAALQTGKHGGNTVEAQWWYREFLVALNRRISSHLGRQGRKYSDGYLERLRMATGGRNADAGYLRRFARKGASCL